MRCFDGRVGPGRLIGRSSCLRPISRFLLGIEREQLPQERDGSIAPLQIAALQILCLARIEVAQRIKMGSTGIILLGEPHLITSKRSLSQDRSEEVGVVSSKYEL